MSYTKPISCFCQSMALFYRFCLALTLYQAYLDMEAGYSLFERTGHEPCSPSFTSQVSHDILEYIDYNFNMHRDNCHVTQVINLISSRHCSITSHESRKCKTNYLRLQEIYEYHMCNYKICVTCDIWISKMQYMKYWTRQCFALPERGFLFTSCIFPNHVTN